MKLRIEERPVLKFAGVRVIGPYTATVAQGFASLMPWIQQHNIIVGKRLAIYYDDPNVVPEQEQRVDTVITVADDFQLPQDSQNIHLGQIDGGLYAIASVQVNDGDFISPWLKLFNELLPEHGYEPTGKPCYDNYLNNGCESGVWNIEMCVAVQKIK